MNNTLDSATLGAPRAAAGLLDRIARRLVLSRLQRLRDGELILIEDGERQFGTPSARCPLRAQVQVLDPRFYTRLAFGGSIGAGEAYMQGLWSCPDLTTLIRVLAANREQLDGMDIGSARWLRPAQRLWHGLRRNTRRGSRRNIAAHYDLSNEFFQLFLDPTMMYSSAVFERADSDLHSASLTKLDLICRKLELKPNDHVLEIGTGWGGFALHAARRYGCRVTTTTISERQYQLARERVLAEGLADRITVLRQDYRALTGQYDKLVSIEMIEAVGHAYLDTFFRQCARLLRPTGMMLLQSITIADQYYERALRSVDFIQRYIFPGGFLPSVAAINSSLARAGDLRLFHLDDIGPHYATTLRHWRARFHANLGRVRALGFGDEFIRMWEFYLSYCEGGFLARSIGTVQMLLTKPDCRRAPLVPVLD